MLFPVLSVGCRLRSNAILLCQSKSLWNLQQRTVIVKKFNKVFYTWYPWPKITPPGIDFTDSGDIEKTVDSLGKIDLSLPITDYRHSKNLQTADEKTRKIYSLEYANRSEVMREYRTQISQRFGAYPKDERASQGEQDLEREIALMTLKIRNLMEHYRQPKNWGDHGSKNVLNKLIKLRNRMVRDYREQNYIRFVWLLRALKLRYTPEEQETDDNKKYFSSPRDVRLKQAIDQGLEMIREKIELLERDFEKECREGEEERRKELERLKELAREVDVKSEKLQIRHQERLKQERKQVLDEIESKLPPPAAEQRPAATVEGTSPTTNSSYTATAAAPRAAFVRTSLDDELTLSKLKDHHKLSS